MEIIDWSDLRQFDESFSPTIIDQVNEDNGQENEDQNNKNNENDNSEDKEQEGKTDGDLTSGYEISDWNDLRKFDDDHDDDWFKYQEKILTEQYGGNFIKVKYSNNGRVAYFCEICFAECNAKKSLELHCRGMKHLKKKDIWEKDGKPQPPMGLEDGENAPPGGKTSSQSGKYKRTKSPQSFGRNRYSPSRRRFSSERNNRGRMSRSRSRDRNRQISHNYGKNYERSRYPESSDYERHHSDRRSFDRRGRYGLPSPPLDRAASPRAPVYPGFSRYSPERKFSPITRRDYGHGKESRYDDYDKRRSSPRPRYGDRSPEFLEKRRSSLSPFRDSYRYPESPRSKRISPPTPPKISSARYEESSSTEKKTNLSNSPTGNLLQKLAECCVRSSEDAELALNVVAALTKSLKEYSQRNNEKKISELLMEAELKVGTVKALKAGMKMLSNFSADSPSDVMFPTLMGINQMASQQTYASSSSNYPGPYSGHFTY